jgi:hypothetical protein
MKTKFHLGCYHTSRGNFRRPYKISAGGNRERKRTCSTILSAAADKKIPPGGKLFSAVT